MNPSCVSWSLTTWAVLLAGGELSPTMVIVQSLPSHFPLEKPAFFMYDAASAGSPVGCLDEVELRALRARDSAGLVEPGDRRAG